MQSATKMYTCDKFLGINEAEDGSTELRMGEASRMENFTVTDGYNLTLRPGILRMELGQERTAGTILAAWSGYIGDTEYFILCDFADEADRLFVYTVGAYGDLVLKSKQTGALFLCCADDPRVKIFQFGGKLYAMSRMNTVVLEDEGFVSASYYVPLVITGASPAGGGAQLESINMLTSLRRMDFSADGEATEYALPAEATAVTEIRVDNIPLDTETAGRFDTDTRIFTFAEAPQKGVGNVEFTYDAGNSGTEESRLRIASMTLAETYNGSSDTRLFVAGDGTNLCYYTGVPMSGDLSQLYFPGMNEVAVDMSDSPITGMVRHYAKLLIFKPDGTYSISYETLTMADGTVTAGFYLRNVNKGFGNDTPGNVQVVNNYPRTLNHGAVYEWRITSADYKDERYAKRVSDMVGRTLSRAGLKKAVACDDNFTKTYYLFLNDSTGTVLVNRYGLEGDVWCIYRSRLCRNVTGAAMCGSNMVFATDTDVYRFSPGTTTDAPEAEGQEPMQIRAVWESGYLSFGADFRRKYSSQIYLSLLPEGNSDISVTASTDRREEYMKKEISMERFSWNTASFTNWTFALNDNPNITRVRLKVKKFVYYKLIFMIEKYGATATVLGYDQQVRFSSMAK